MKETSLPENIRRLGDNETFRFSCHPGVPCFNECCRQLDLALTPYDIIRLRRALGISSSEFLERYVMVEKTDADIIPLLFLTMVDDGRASCPLVGEQGCTVYPDRPGACRTYPAGRGAYLDEHGRPADFHVLLTEPHCQGFATGPELSLAEWIADQELTNYNKLNDEVMSILHHRRIKEGFRPNDRQQERYLTVLYDLDAFQQEIGADDLKDTELLRKAIATLHNELFK
jgi:Fe-S-cluster containining protein